MSKVVRRRHDDLSTQVEEATTRALGMPTARIDTEPHDMEHVGEGYAADWPCVCGCRCDEHDPLPTSDFVGGFCTGCPRCDVFFPDSAKVAQARRRARARRQDNQKRAATARVVMTPKNLG